MADRYQDRPFPADDGYSRGGHQAPAKGEADPLAELARLIGQTDPFAGTGTSRGHAQAAPAHDDRDQDQESEPAPEEDTAPSGPPPWMQRANAHERSAPTPDFARLHPVQRYAPAQQVQAPQVQAPEPDYHQQDYQQASSFEVAQGLHDLAHT